ncbi:MAG: prepilin-type N-terminal cleavage/methylation domain-containing protein [Desulfomicrobiaceae bacterium]|jgi:prepilin-type N-terminal cleavage/methylation domain-containing protein
MMKPQGFTLIEIAIVLVIIGLILGMVFKGKQLIDQTRVKQLEAQYTKIIGALETFHERYGFYPGDGCVNQTYTPATPFTCTGPKDGLLFDGSGWGGTNNGHETEAAWYLLINVTGILTETDRRSLYGQPWDFIGGINRLGGTDTTGTWLDLPGVPQADPRVVCALDQQTDDGRSQGGRIRTLNKNYLPTTDCWSLSGQANVHLKVIP